MLILRTADFLWTFAFSHFDDLIRSRISLMSCPLRGLTIIWMKWFFSICWWGLWECEWYLKWDLDYVCRVPILYKYIHMGMHFSYIAIQYRNLGFFYIITSIGSKFDVQFRIALSTLNSTELTIVLSKRTRKFTHRSLNGQNPFKVLIWHVLSFTRTFLVLWEPALDSGSSWVQLGSVVLESVYCDPEVEW